MRVAVLHDYLNQSGGAERVLLAILGIFPDADLYTLLYDKDKTSGLFEKNITKTSFLDSRLVREKHRAFIPFMPMAAKRLKAKGYDLVISSTAGYGKGIAVEAPYHICYCHSPLRYAWEIDYLKDLPFAPWPLKEMVVKPIANRLKAWDKKAAERVNLFVANSKFIAKKINSYYGRDAVVLYPPVDTDVFYPDTETERGNYYLMVGRLLYYKRFDLGIQAFNRLKKPLYIIGRGPETEKLKSLATSPLITFVPYVTDGELRKLYSGAQALVFPQVEDFGLVAAEAQACGCPVLAYRGGGAEEIVMNRKTGLFFGEQRPEAIMESVRESETMRWNRAVIAKNAERFSAAAFRRGFEAVVRNAGYYFHTA